MISPKITVMAPQSVPARVSVVLVEEAKVGGAGKLQCPRVDQDLRLLAGMTKLASVTVAENSHISSSVGKMLSSLARTEDIVLVVPAGSLIPVGSVGPDGPFGMTSLSDLTVSELVTLKTDSVGPMGPSVTCGPVGSYRTLSPCDVIIDPDQPVARWARLMHLARWALMGCYPGVALISRWLMAQWARTSHLARWAHMGCYPGVTQISLLLMA